MTEDTKRRIAELAATAERDIDEGRIVLTGEAAEREMARRAEAKHAARMTQGDVAADLRYGAAALGVMADQSKKVAPRLSQHSSTLERAADYMRQVAEGLERAPSTPAGTEAELFPRAAETAVHVNVPRGFVPSRVYTNRETKEITFDGAARCRLCGGALVFIDTTADGRIDPNGWLKCESCGHRDIGAAPAALRELVEGLLGKETPKSRAAVEQYFACVDAVPDEKEQAALAFCFRIALEHDHGGAQKLRRLLYAWHNGRELGGFDFADLWSLDDTYRGHALTLINMIARSPVGWYAEHYGYGADMVAIIEQHHPSGGDRRRQ